MSNRKRCQIASVLAIALSMLVGAANAIAEDPATSTADKNIATESLPLRTALHHDPSLKAPLDRLLTLYRGAGRLHELLNLYRSHVAQYPQDQNARVVLVRLKVATGDPEALRATRQAVDQFADNAYLQYILYELLARRHDPKAIDRLDAAIALQKHPNRRLSWIDQLLAVATVSDRRDLAKKHLVALAQETATAEARLEVARKMNKFRFFGLALQQLEKQVEQTVGPETLVAIQLEATAAEVGLNEMDKAAARLDQLLDNLTADYWQREEINRRRLALIGSQSEREALIASRRKLVDKTPNDVAAVLDLAQILSGLQRRREALALLLEAGRRLPNSEQIEKRTLEMFDRLRDDRGRNAYLAERLARHPKRDDLALMRIKTEYQLGRRSDAKAAFTKLAASLSGAKRIGTVLEMARFLRRSTLLSDAADLYRQLLELAPARLDVRRELAETYLAMGQRGRVRSLFSGNVSEPSSLENLLDMVQFMISQELLVEARLTLERRLKIDEGNFDLQLLLLSISQKLGDFRGGEQQIEDARQVADTAARYRQWLEAAAAFHEEFESTAAFLDEELLRLDEDPAQPAARRLERRLAYADVAANNRRLDAALALLQQDLEQELPAEFRVKFRRQLIEVLEKDPKRLADIQEQLKLLGDEDQRYADESKARLAILQVRMRRQDLAVPLLDKIDLTQIQDPSLLGSLEHLYRQQNRPNDVLLILGRLTQLNPTDRNNWQRWLTVLAGTGDENRLRGALRQLLAGVNKLPLTDDTRMLLEKHLADSFWRSIARDMAGDNEAAIAEALVLLDSVERMAQDNQNWLWVNWIRAYALNRLDRKKERDEAIGELERIVALVHKPDDENKPDEIRIALPDGLTIQLRQARRLLQAAPVAAVMARPTAGSAPLPPLNVQWTFDLGPRLPIGLLIPVTNGRLLVAAINGDTYCIDSASGKLIWRKSGILSARPAAVAPAYVSFRSPHYPVQHHSRTPTSPIGNSRPLCDDQGMLHVPASHNVACYDTSDGRLVWRADVGATGRPSGPPIGAGAVSIFLYGDKLLTFEPVSGTVAKVDRTSGKVVWERRLAPISPTAVTVTNSGASLSGDRLMVYGARSAILDVRTGEILYSFEPWRVREFPIPLKDPGEVDKVPPTAPVPSATSATAVHSPFAVPARRQSLVSTRRGTVAAPVTQHVNYILAANPNIAAQSASPQFRMGLSSPAVAWAAGNQAQPRRANLIGRRLLLWNQTGLQILSTDLPLASRQLAVHGRLIGTVGRKAVFLYSGQLQILDLVNGTVKHLQANEPSSASAGGNRAGIAAPVQVLMQGPLVYTTGPGGVHCFNALTAERIFRYPWPQELASEKTVAPTPQAVQLQKLLQLRGHHHGGPQVIGRYPLNAATVLPGTAACIHDGVLYTVVSPSRIVALRGVAADGD